MIILNFAHPLTQAQLEKIELISTQPIEAVHDIPVQFENDQPFADQILSLTQRIPLDSLTLQTEPLLVNLPSLNYIAAGLLAWLNGQMGFFPAILRLKGLTDSAPMIYDVSEIINLQKLRDQSRKQR